MAFNSNVTHKAAMNAHLLSSPSISPSDSSPHQVQLSAPSKPNELNSAFQYKSSTTIGRRSESSTPLVVVLPWLQAQEKHINKYTEFYIEKGYDVLVVNNITVSSFLWPNNSFTLVEQLHEELKGYDQRPLIFHSWSVGSYMLAVLFHQISRHPETYADVSCRTIACIADSVTVGSPARMVTGISLAVGKGPVSRTLIQSTIAVYLFFTHNWTVKVYEELVDAFTHYPLTQTPMLYFYSRNDPMCDASSLEELIDTQKKSGREIFSKNWEVSSHAQHMARHPQEYKSTLTQFLMAVDPHNGKLLKSAL